jgi:hypothetical protein
MNKELNTRKKISVQNSYQNDMRNCSRKQKINTKLERGNESSKRKWIWSRFTEF